MSSAIPAHPAHCQSCGLMKYTREIHSRPVPAPRTLAAVDSFLKSFAEEDVLATTLAAFAATSDGVGAMIVGVEVGVGGNVG